MTPPTNAELEFCVGFLLPTELVLHSTPSASLDSMVSLIARYFSYGSYYTHHGGTT
jgi:hypothetical protein